MKYLISLYILVNTLFANHLFEPLPKNIEYDKNIIKLGRELFYDPILSKNKDISCFSCHSNYGVDNRKFSIGTNNRIGFINSPSIFNLKYKNRYFWNGRAKTLKEQLTGPLFAEHEMANDKKTIDKRLKEINRYKELFKSAYNQSPSFELALDAIVKFEETLLSVDSKFDKFLREEVELSKEEQKGYDLFVSYGCASCHNGINIGGNSYQKFGSIINNIDSSKKWEDRFTITKDEKDKMVFIVPSLRNVEKTAPYFHNGEINNLKDAIKLMGYYNIGLNLKDEEITYIEAFLKTLTGNIPETLYIGN